MRVIYSDPYHVDIGEHVFPTAKYHLVYQSLMARGVVTTDRVVAPETASWDELAAVHTASYLRKLRDGDLSLTEVARLEIPPTPAAVDGFRLMTGGTVTAARLALSDGGAVHLGGGFHHAFASHGEGFCMFNDVALATRLLLGEGRVARVAIVDCDVHHGNGTAAIFRDDPGVLTSSLHQERNYPIDKPPSTIDIALDDGVGDDEYLGRLAEVLPTVMAHRPELLFYLAGADPYARDQLGGLALSQDGLRARDRAVFDAAGHDGVPVVVTLAGGYAHDVADTVAIHVATVEEAMSPRPKE